MTHETRKRMARWYGFTLLYIAACATILVLWRINDAIGGLPK